MLDRARARRRPGRGCPTPTDAGQRTRRSRRRSASTTRAAVRTTPSAPGSVASRTCGQDRARRRRRRSPSVLVAPMSRPIALHRRLTGPTLPSCSTSVTATAPGLGVATRADPVGRSVVRTGPAPLRPRPAGAGCGERGLDVGLPVRVADLEHQRPPSGRSVDPGATTASAGSPHGTSPTAMVPGRVDPTTRAPARSGSSPSTVTDRGRALGQQPSSATRRLDLRSQRRRVMPVDARFGRLGQARLGEPARPDGVDDRGLDLPDQRDVLVGTDAEQVGAGGEREHRGLRDAAAGGRAGHVEGVADDHAVEAEPVAQQRRAPARSASPAAPGRAPAPRCARSSPPPTPASTAAANGTSSRATSVVEVDVDDRQREVAVLRRCRRGPGSAWRTRRRRPPAARRSRRRRAPATRSRVGAEAAGADHRVVGVAVHVGDRAEVEVDADRGQLRRRSPGRSPGSARGRRRHRAPAARAPGCRSSACSRVTSPPSSSTAITARGRAARIGAVSAATASGPSAVLLPNRQSPPRPSASSSAHVGGQRRTGERRQQHRAGRGGRGTLIPSPPRR